MRIPNVLMLFIVALATSGFAAQAHADGGTVLVLASGDEETQLLLRTNAKQALSDAGVQVASDVDAERAGFEADRTIACIDEAAGECTGHLQRAPVQWVLLIRGDRGDATADADITITTKLFSADTGALLQVEQRICEQCSSRERLARLVTELISQVTTSELAHEATATYLDIVSTPEGAVLRIDGSVVGPTGKAYRVAPGEHEIFVEHPGYRTVSQMVTVGTNEHKTVSITLARTNGVLASNGAAEESSPMTLRGWLSVTAMAAGAVAMAGGVTWVVVDGDPVDTGPNQQPLATKDTMTLGVTSLVVGGALFSAGLISYLTEDVPQAPPVTEGATARLPVFVSPSTDGLSLGYYGRF